LFFLPLLYLITLKPEPAAFHKLPVSLKYHTPTTMKRYLFVIVILLAAFIGGIVGSIYTFRFLDYSVTHYASVEERQNLVLTNFRKDSSYAVPADLDFLATAKQATRSVVHIRTSYGPGDFSFNPLEFRHDWSARSSGSGVILSDDGYVVTNFHVIEDASNVEVVMHNNQRYFAKVVGSDPSTDLALLKIKGRDLPFIRYGNSDNLQLGEWVLAIGNPFDLNSTVTAGIVSAKARNIGILRDRNNLQVESFIQTDAAVNPGNSGGALVNLSGELMGINSAIATSNGSYQGYSFAIPVTLVKKVIDDLLEFGQVQRGLLGVQITDVNAAIAEDLNLPVQQGILVSRVNENSAAEQSGIKQGDVIVSINRQTVNTVSELQELVARNRPGTEVSVTFLRNGEQRMATVRLRNSEGKEVVETKEIKYEFDGAQVEDVNYKVLANLNLEGGVKLNRIAEGKWKKAGIKEGFIIGFIDKLPVNNVEDFNRILDFKKGGILLEGYYLNGEKGTYGVEW
jgi:serine protease Do